jgi:hypothetical protein
MPVVEVVPVLPVLPEIIRQQAMAALAYKAVYRVLQHTMPEAVEVAGKVLPV